MGRWFQILSLLQLTFLLLAAMPSLASAYTNYNDDIIPNSSLQAKKDIDVYFDPKDMKNEQDPKRLYFDVVVVINKARNAQTIDVYRFGELWKHALVSTGRETPEYSNPSDPKAPTHDYFSQTFTGYYNVQGLDIDHYSKTWTDAFMPWAVFFDSGIATHRSPHENLALGIIDPNIGTRASGGCVRLHQNDAKDVFWWVRMSGGPFTKAELSTLGEPGGPDFAKEAEEQEKLGEHPYDKAQVVPLINKDGSFRLDSNGMVKTQWGYKTLYIVEDVPLPGRGNLRASAPAQRARARQPAPPKDPVSQFFTDLFGGGH